MKKFIAFTLIVMLALSLTACDFLSDIFNKEPTETPDSRQKFATTPQETPAPTPQETPAPQETLIPQETPTPSPQKTSSQAWMLDDDGYFLFTREAYLEAFSRFIEPIGIELQSEPEGFGESTYGYPYLSSMLFFLDEGNYSGSMVIFFHGDSDKVFTISISYRYGQNPADDAELAEMKSRFILLSAVAAGFDLSGEEMLEIFYGLPYGDDVSGEYDTFGTKDTNFGGVFYNYSEFISSSNYDHLLLIASPLWLEIAAN